MQTTTQITNTPANISESNKDKPMNHDNCNYAIVSVLSYSTGYYFTRTNSFVRAVYRKWKMGICFHYKGSGVRENRNGTILAVNYPSEWSAATKEWLIHKREC